MPQSAANYRDMLARRVAHYEHELSTLLSESYPAQITKDHLEFYRDCLACWDAENDPAWQLLND